MSMLREYKCRVYDLSVELYGDAIVQLNQVSGKSKSIGSKGKEVHCVYLDVDV